MNFTIIISNVDEANNELLFDEFPNDNKYNVKVCNEDFRNIENYDCIVSPGNSHGIMDGGMDFAISRNFGNRDEFIKNIQDQLKLKCNCKQMPGSAKILKINSEKCKYLLHLPTMNIPSRITNKEILYWNIYNMLHKVDKHNIKYDNDIKVICMSGLGTGCGRVQYNQFIKLFKLAYDHYLLNIELDTITWNIANRQYFELKTLINSFPIDDEDIYQSINMRRLSMQFTPV
jgi:O-acetyl-ADP-ribose deacetylase (regulator of RNase III)